MDVLIVTGMSGAGKSNAVNALEDIGYFCADNIPPNLLPAFLEEVKNGNEAEKVAVVIDMRAGLSFSNLINVLDETKKTDYSFKTLFIDADDDVLIRRYKETRRLHPLVNKDSTLSVTDAVSIERMYLQPTKNIADIVIDSTNLSVSQLRNRIKDTFLSRPENSFVMNFISFGYKYGIPRDCDFVFDLRGLVNPYYVPELKHKTGLDKEVRDFVMADENSKKMQRLLEEFILFILPLSKLEGKSQIVIGFGCTGGHHRSVTFAEIFNDFMDSLGYRSTVHHRDCLK